MRRRGPTYATSSNANLLVQRRKVGREHLFEPAPDLPAPPERIARVSDADAYAKAGVDQGAADSAVAGLVRALGAIELGRPSRQVPLPGHYASVIKLDERLGIALSTDGVGTKLLVAEQLGRFDTVGIDCVAMNVNDVICVGAEPLAMLDYIAIERADPEVCEQIGVGLARGAELAGVEIPGGELAQLGEMVRGFDVSGACFGTVALDAIVDGCDGRARRRDRSACPPPGSTPTATRSPARRSTAYRSTRTPRAASAVRSATSCSSRPRSTSSLCSSCCAPRSTCAASPTSPPAASSNLLRLAAEVGYEIDAPLPVPPIFDLIQERAGVSDEEMHDGLQHGLRLLLRRRRRRRGCGARAAAAPLPGGASGSAAVDGPRPRRGSAHRAGEPHGVDAQTCPLMDTALQLDDRNRALRPLPAGGEARQRRHVDRLPGPRRHARPAGRGQGHAPRDVRAGRPARALPPGGARGRQALPPQRRRGDRRRRGRRPPLHRLRVRRRARR